MTRTMMTLVLILAPLLMTQGAYGQTYDASLYDRIPVTLAAKVKNPEALETFYGEILETRQIRDFSRTDIERLLEGSQIEMRDGQIFYPEEVEYILRLRSGIKDRAPHEKAPHTPN